MATPIRVFLMLPANQSQVVPVNPDLTVAELRAELERRLHLLDLPVVPIEALCLRPPSASLSRLLDSDKVGLVIQPNDVLVPLASAALAPAPSPLREARGPGPLLEAAQRLVPDVVASIQPSLLTPISTSSPSSSISTNLPFSPHVNTAALLSVIEKARQEERVNSSSSSSSLSSSSSSPTQLTGSRPRYSSPRSTRKNSRGRSDEDGSYSESPGLPSATGDEDGVFSSDFQCPTCLKVFSSRSNMQRHHMNVHEKKKPFHCPVPGCPGDFSDRNALEIHLRRHSGERPFVCDFPGCDASFVSPFPLKRHLMAHGVEVKTQKRRKGMRAAIILSEMDNDQFGGEEEEEEDIDLEREGEEEEEEEEIVTAITTDIIDPHLLPSDPHLLTSISTSPEHVTAMGGGSSEVGAGGRGAMEINVSE